MVFMFKYVIRNPEHTPGLHFQWLSSNMSLLTQSCAGRLEEEIAARARELPLLACGPLFLAYQPFLACSVRFYSSLDALLPECSVGSQTNEGGSNLFLLTVLSLLFSFCLSRRHPCNDLLHDNLFVLVGDA